MAKTRLGKVKITRDNVQAVIASIENLAKSKVMVGIPQDKNSRRPEAFEQGAPLPPNNAQIGYWMEFGTETVPARPWLYPGAKLAEPKVINILKKTAILALSGDANVTTRGLMAAGLTAQSSIKDYIINGHFLPLSPLTLAKRRARGVTREEPLRDTLQMLNAVTYVIRPR